MRDKKETKWHEHGQQQNHCYQMANICNQNRERVNDDTDNREVVAHNENKDGWPVGCCKMLMK